MHRYAVGLDIGIASVGWAVVGLDTNDHPCGIIDMGSRIFDAAEHPKTGASLALPRREARSSRRRLRRCRHRKERIRALMLSVGLVSETELATLFCGQLEDIYALRVRALDEKVTQKELARILLHLAQRRGFRSNRKNGNSDEDGKLLAAVSANRRCMEDHGYRTVAEMMLNDTLYQEHKRNKAGSYLATVGREMVEQEVRAIFTAQRSFGHFFASEAFEESYLEILLSQRSFDEGPGGESPYSGSQIERMVGKCTFEPEEPRAAKATYSFEYFTLLQKINHIRLICNGEILPLTAEQRELLIALSHKSDNLSFANIRKELKLSEEVRFNVVRYQNSEDWMADEKTEKFCYLKNYHKMRVALDKLSKGLVTQLSVAQRNDIATALTLYKTSAKIREHLTNVSEAYHDAIEGIGSLSKFGHLSVKACNKLIPFLEQGMNYNDACEAAGYYFRGHEGSQKSPLLHLREEDMANLTSPVGKRAVSQCIKVLNAIIRRQGSSPVFINIELGREMAKDFSERKKLEKENEQNRARNERIMDRLRTEYGVKNPTGQDLLKLRLFEDQAGVCAYSQRQMSLQQLFMPDYAEIDHIIPYSISFDDSYKNKVLVLAEENRMKGNRLPLEYLQGNRRDDYIVWVNSAIRDHRKRAIMLKECITPADEEKFKERNLQDTKTMSRFLLNYINDHLAFAPSLKGCKKRVTAVNGSVTGYMRKRWGITKVRADGDLHHAVDALVIACTTDGMIQQISRHACYKECKYIHAEAQSFAVEESTGEILQQFPYPWPQFRQELDARLSSDPTRVVLDRRLPFYIDAGEPISLKPLFVSRMPKRKISGPAHLDTVRSAKMLDQGYTVSKKPLTALKLDKVGEIANYFNPNSDRLLYQALKERLKMFGGDGAKAFAEPFYKPKHDGTPGPVVHKVKVCEKTTLNVEVHGGKGIANHDSMVRIDVFHVEGDGYYLVPIYIADTLKEKLPNRACVAHKPYNEWKLMKDEDFLFSLYPNDLIRVRHKSGIKLTKVRKESTLPESRIVNDELLYYRGSDITSGSILLINHDNTYTVRLGIKTLPSIEKYTVDVLGDYHRIEKEVRQRFCRKRG